MTMRTTSPLFASRFAGKSRVEKDAGEILLAGRRVEMLARIVAAWRALASS